MALIYGAQCDVLGCGNAHIYRWDKSANKGKVQANLRKAGWSFGKIVMCAECNARAQKGKEEAENESDQ